MSTAEICMMISIVVYLICVIGIGITTAKKNKQVDEFYLGGRKLGPFVTAMSAEASDMSSWLLMGLPGVAYLTGVAEAFWTALGLAIGTYVNWLIVAKRIRRYSQRINAITIPDFFSKRFHDDSHVLEAIAALVIIIFFVPYTASGFRGCGVLFNTLFGFDYATAMIVSAVVILIYTTLGGFLAASTSDFMQSIIMTIALAVILIFGINEAGGMDAVMSAVKTFPEYLSLTETINVSIGEVGSYSGLTIASTLAWGLGYFGMPHILLRFMAIEDEDKLKLSRRVASVWVVIAMSIAIVIGFIGYAMTKAGAIELLPTASRAQAVIVEMAGVLSTYGIIPALVAGVIMAGILASTMSTADSQLLAASSSVTENIVRNFFKVKLSKKETMILARAAVIGISVMGMILALDENSSVFAIVSFAWAGFGATFGPLMLFSLFWKRTTKWGALAGMVSGGVMVFVWKYLIAPMGGVLAIYELLPAFLVSAAFIVVVSLLTPEPSDEIKKEFDESVKGIRF